MAIGIFACLGLCHFTSAGIACIENPLVPNPTISSNSPRIAEPQDLLWPEGVSGGVELLESQPGQIRQLDAASVVDAHPSSPSTPALTSSEAADGASAIPLPPAVQSGLSGMLALALAGLFKPIRRAFRS
ncbi:MAG TPA: hypothetical protein VK797_01920 [Tepidisphaeraceae bacterium]|nr:hypothetical protein [Tepidisphaeraceae bacterium]